MLMSVRALYCAVLAAFLCASGALHAQDASQYPNKPIRIFVGFAAGGFTDVMARILAAKMAESWNQQVIVDNRPGAGTIVATDLVAKAPADGYTLLMMTDNHATNPSLFKSLPYDSEKDFAPVTLGAMAPFMLLVHPTLPAKDVRELVALAKARPGQLMFGSGGIGGPGHLAGELLNTMAGTKMTHIPYKGGALAMIDLQAGQVQLYFGNLPISLPHVKTGKVRCLAVTSARRALGAPEFPTVGETVKGFELSPWYGVLTRAGTPPDVLAKLNRELAAILHNPDIRSRLIAQGAEPVGNSQAEFAAFLRTETVKWGKLVRDSGARSE